MACVDAERTRPIGPDELIHWPEEDGRSLAGRIEKRENGRALGVAATATGDGDVGTESGVCHMPVYNIRKMPRSSSPTADRTCLPPSTSSPCSSRVRKIFPTLVFFPINMQGEMSASLVSPRSPTFLSGQRLGVVDTDDIVDQHLHSFDVTNPLPIMEHILRWRDVWESHGIAMHGRD